MNNLGNKDGVVRGGMWLAVVTGCAVGLTGIACGVGQDDELGDLDADRIIEIANDSTCVTLYAGQTIEVGTVCGTIDNTVDTSAQCGAGSTGVINVEYTTTGGWTLAETHLAAGDSLSDIPANKKGNPQIGHFPYAGSHTDGTTSASYAVPLCTFGLDGADDVCDPVNSYFAAHAVVEKVNADGSVSNETAWGDGERMVQKGSWAEYFNLQLECSEDIKPPKAECETAFALAGDGTETCFIGADFDGDGQDDGISRWGWSNGPLAAGSARQWPVYAAAGQCDLGRGELVGYLTVDYDGATAEITFDRVGDFALDEEQIYIGNEPLPRNDQGEYTVAPGQYPIVVELDEATSTTNTVTGLSGDIYVVYHAVACGSFGGGGDPGGGDDGGAGDDGGKVDPLASFNDEFDGDLSAWSVYHPEAAAVSISGGNLVIEPNAGPWWYNGGEAVHVNQEMTGNFAVSTYIDVTTLQGGPTVPGTPYRVGGLMIRDPNNSSVNSYHIAIGNMGTPTLTVVSKSTDDSYSTIGIQEWNETFAELKVCRVGDDIQSLIRVPGDSWRIIDWHVRPDIPATVVTGPTAYAGPYGAADLRASCDWVHFETVETLHDCMLD